MFLDEKELKNSENQYELIGTVSEYNLTLKQNTQKVKIDNEEKVINSSILYGKITTDVNGNTYENNILISKFKKNGDEKKSFRGLCTIAGIEYDKDTYTFGDRPLKPTIDSVTAIIPRGAKSKDEHKIKEQKGVGVDADRVCILGQTDRHDYLNKDQSNLTVTKQLTANNVTTQNVPSVDKATFDIGGCVYAINDEYNKQGQATGRKLVDLVNLGFYGGNVFTLVVPKEWDIVVEGKKQTLTAKDFIDFAKQGQTITAHGDIEAHTFGKVANTSAKAFGQGSEIKSGYTILEWTIKGANVEAAYDIDDIKQIKKEYDIYLDMEYKKKLEQQKEYNEKKNGKPTSKGLGMRSSSIIKSDDDESDNPFAADDTVEDPFA
jgi:hypothetical protein